VVTKLLSSQLLQIYKMGGLWSRLTWTKNETLSSKNQNKHEHSLCHGAPSYQCEALSSNSSTTILKRIRSTLYIFNITLEKLNQSCMYRIQLVNLYVQLSLYLGVYALWVACVCDSILMLSYPHMRKKANTT
jgi:hypothetical protein